jgi:hypothetical protein
MKRGLKCSVCQHENCSDCVGGLLMFASIAAMFAVTNAFQIGGQG